MKKSYIMLGVLVLVVGGVVFGVAKGPSEVTTRIVLTGPEGLQVTAKGTADGQSYSIASTLPNSLSTTAKRMSVSLVSSDPSQGFFADVFVNDKKLVAGGGTPTIQIDVSGNTLFSTSRAFLQAGRGSQDVPVGSGIQ